MRDDAAGGDLGEALRRSRPVISLRDNGAQIEARVTDWIAVQQETAEPELAAAPDRRRSRWRVGGVIGLVAVVLGVGTPLAAGAITHWMARTGQFGGEGTEVVDDSEWIDLDAPDAPELVTDLYPDYLSLPPGLREEQVSGAVAQILTPDDGPSGDPTGGVQMQEVGIAYTYEFVARCAWYTEWIAADDASDETRRDKATLGIETAAGWPATAASDGGGIVAALNAVVRDAQRGDRAAVIDGYKIESCPSVFGAVVE